jgi:hypothetical protein
MHVSFREPPSAEWIPAAKANASRRLLSVLLSMQSFAARAKFLPCAHDMAFAICQLPFAIGYWLFWLRLGRAVSIRVHLWLPAMRFGERIL